MSEQIKYAIETIDLYTPMGGVVNSLQRDACSAALDHRCNVRFVHNDRVFLVDYHNLMACCKQIDVSDNESENEE